MNNRWNRIIYKLWAPVYDRVFNSGAFAQARVKVLSGLDLRPDQRVLLVGAGTGADLPLISGRSLSITAIDLSPEMLAEARSKVMEDERITFLEMDAQNLDFEDESFDVVIANLILSVVPDSGLCMQEIVRVTAGGGKIVIFDKFAANGRLSPIMKALRPLTSVLGTDIGRDFNLLFLPHQERVHITEDRPLLMHGMYRKIVLRKAKGGLTP
ncbi:phosphatidylethanolamine N-methyltransferase [Bacillus sp. FJAT-27264]|uniref:class I SAM-dependent methyltransferase n=1 Tax=Paenibacillus sp. (strain DSM 101736 / FJAT-27264) TaxID=1850362 RepID=UPI000807ACCC|nr:class I SAM-dependent methyltransferase [Bacillus sp. FJAT-27264]OBZ18023.1 phosphatidylethanolamine N-methyltransferase [Bacillus sp. FJAT-27264]